MTRGALLEVVAGKAHGLTLEVQDDLLIGRHAEGPGRLAEDEELSRAHARISVDGTGVCAIEDLGSTNGTFVNGLRISAPITLSEGDAVEIGATTLVVRELPDAGQLPTSLPLRLEIDFAAREARIFLTDTSTPVRLVFEQGEWRPVLASGSEKGRTQ
jgi:pSer/pThr/pTyr-binding forkhead associated (FHA) protein